MLSLSNRIVSGVLLDVSPVSVEILKRVLFPCQSLETMQLNTDYLGIQKCWKR